MGGGLVVGVPPTGATATTFATVQLAHSENSLVDGACRPLNNVVTLPQQASAYRAMGITGVTTTVITDWMSQSTLQCRRPYQIASWDELVGLQHDDAWEFVSGSQHGDNLLLLSPAAAKAEICQSGQIMTQHGLAGAYGEFAFPDNKSDGPLEQAALSCGYFFGRLYGGGITAVPVASPYWLHTFALNGGACADSTKSCYSLSTRYHYADPAVLRFLGQQDPAHWKVVQGYAFVTGAVTSDLVSWDCTSPDWHEHWTSGGDATEVYCWNDWVAALASWHGVQFVNPGQMRSQRQNG
jgi:hypothetical protein